MQTLFYGLIGRNDSIDSKKDSKQDLKQDYETLDCPEAHTIIQIHRKIKLLNEFKNYIKNTKKNTLYFKYIIGTKIHEYDYYHDQEIIYTIMPGIFGRLCEYRTSENSDDFFKTLLFLEL